MTPKQQRFVDEYLVDLNATQAAIRAGYSPDCAAEIGYENLRKPHIAEAVKRGSSEVQERTQVTQEWVIARLVDNIERCRQAVPVTDKKGEQLYALNDDGDIAPLYTFNAAGANKGLELLAKHLGMFIERHEHTVTQLTESERMERLATIADAARARRAGQPAPERAN